LIDKRQHSNIVDVQLTVIVTISSGYESYRLSVSKQAVQKFGVERFNLKKLNDVEVKVQYHVELPTRFAAFETYLHDDDDDDDDDDVDVSKAWESIRM
jgi:hypothetical protein